MRTYLTRARPVALLALALALAGWGTRWGRASTADAAGGAGPGVAPGADPSAHYALAADEGEAIWFLGGLLTVKTSGAATGGALAVVESMGRPGSATPRHVHWTEDEAFYVLDGALRGYCGDQEWRAGPGSFVWLPRGVVHGFTNEGDQPVRKLIITAPSGFERFVAEVGEPARARVLPPPAPPDAEKLRAAAARHGQEILGPPGT